MFGIFDTPKKKPKATTKGNKVYVSFKTKSGKKVNFKATRPKSSVKIVSKKKTISKKKK